MCWTSRSYPVLKTAEEDIPIIKIGIFVPPIHCISPCYRKTYIFHLTYYETIGKILKLYNNTYDINEGFHSYRQVEGMDIITQDFGLLIYFNNQLIDDWPKSCIAFKGVIPKGSQYYENDAHEVVSAQLRIIGIYK